MDSHSSSPCGSRATCILFIYQLLGFGLSAPFCLNVPFQYSTWESFALQGVFIICKSIPSSFHIFDFSDLRPPYRHPHFAVEENNAQHGEVTKIEVAELRQNLSFFTPNSTEAKEVCPLCIWNSVPGGILPSSLCPASLSAPPLLSWAAPPLVSSPQGVRPDAGGQRGVGSAAQSSLEVRENKR